MLSIISRMHYVTESLLVGNVNDAEHPPPSVGAVLFLAAERKIEPPAGVLFERVPLNEFSEADPADVKRAVDWLGHHLAAHRVMVCCRAGMGRSVSVVITYLCCMKGMPYTEAVQLLKARRPGATPLPNLEVTIEKVRQLKQAGDAQDQSHDGQPQRPQT